VRYIVNLSSTTQSDAYYSSLVYVATANF
jgi:hypothetical protein